MIVKVTATNLSPGLSPQEVTQQITQIIEASTGRNVKVNVTSRDNMTGVDITRILPK